MPRTFLTDSLLDFAAEVVRRLSGVAVATSANFSMTTQFGGGKTHALTLLYHLAENGPTAESWQGVDRIMQRAGVATLPKAKVAVFVGQRFDPRGGEDGTPLRRTPWGELAWLLAGEAGYRVMAPFDEQGHAPGGDTIARVLDLVGGPALILMDELINYVSRYRASGLGRPVVQLSAEPERRGAHAHQCGLRRLAAGVAGRDERRGRRGLQAHLASARPAEQVGDHVGGDRRRRNHPSSPLRLGTG